MPVQKNNGRRRSESGGGAVRSGSGTEKLVQQRKREEDRNPDMDPHLRVMERFREFLCESNRDVITCPKGEDVR